MANELRNAAERMRGQAAEFPQLVFGAERDALKLVMQLATTRYMIPTGQRGKRPRPNVPVDPARLTWRSGALARSLTRQDDPENIFRVEEMAPGLFVATAGTRKPYGPIHELGGTTGPHAININQEMRRFFWRQWYESGKRDEMWKRMALTEGPIQHPGSKIRPRPFLAPAAADKEAVENAKAILGARATKAVAALLRTAFSGQGA